MLEKFRESNFYKKMKQIRVNRAVLISAVTILLALAVVLAITAAANRAKKNVQDEKPPVSTPSETGTDSGTQAPPPSESETDNQQTSSDNVIPGQFVAPTSGLIGKEHDATVQVFSPTMGDYRVHLGIDVSASDNAPVMAAADGVIKQIWNDPRMGTCVAIQHGGDCCTIYKNLAKDVAEGISVGGNVKAGQVIAYVGNTAMLESADVPHLHLEMTVGGLSVNPMDYFDRASFGAEDVYEDESGSGSTGK